MTYTKSYKVIQDGEAILSVVVTFDSSKLYTDITWDSKTGIISAIVDGERVVLPHIGNSYGAIPPGNFETEGFSVNDMNYHYWYY